ncbi:CAP domain-containing protein [Bacillus sp. 165]|uniref:CAP domain-containing protein n=1 Tax=Bacillus sp. 165 TaxID=1529117 RepID=UPI001ADAD5B0|nr:CAP domain-containing protein [Bacillus sp. 165]MBO9130292.1 CAP domain-containing protein [Bacillus sp. 165]
MKKLGLILFFTGIFLFINLYGKLILSELTSDKKNMLQPPDFTEQNGSELPSDDAVSHMLGKSMDELLSIYGEPERIDPSSYDYQWWVYREDLSSYVQFGIFNSRVVTIFTAGEKVDVSPFHIGENYDEVIAQVPFSNEIALKVNNSSYQFELSEDELSEKPLVSVENGWAQLYFDKFTKELTAIRYLDNETIIKQRPYELIYSGEILTPRPLKEEQVAEIERADAEQILDLTNIMRKRHDLSIFTWNEEAAQVAYLHSKDMKEQNYFDHRSPKFGTLGDRLKYAKVSFKLAGENIAMNYTDAPAVVQGWMNSEGHRENILNLNFTELGVGVFEKYYTQNFISR